MEDATLELLLRIDEKLVFLLCILARKKRILGIRVLQLGMMNVQYATTLGIALGYVRMTKLGFSLF